MVRVLDVLRALELPVADGAGRLIQEAGVAPALEEYGRSGAVGPLLQALHADLAPDVVAGLHALLQVDGARTALEEAGRGAEASPRPTGLGPLGRVLNDHFSRSDPVTAALGALTARLQGTGLLQEVGTAVLAGRRPQWGPVLEALRPTADDGPAAAMPAFPVPVAAPGAGPVVGPASAPALSAPPVKAFPVAVPARLPPPAAPKIKAPPPPVPVAAPPAPVAVTVAGTEPDPEAPVVNVGGFDAVTEATVGDVGAVAHGVPVPPGRPPLPVVAGGVAPDMRVVGADPAAQAAGHQPPPPPLAPPPQQEGHAPVAVAPVAAAPDPAPAAFAGQGGQRPADWLQGPADQAAPLAAPVAPVEQAHPLIDPAFGAAPPGPAPLVGHGRGQGRDPEDRDASWRAAGLTERTPENEIWVSSWWAVCKGRDPVGPVTPLFYGMQAVYADVRAAVPPIAIPVEDVLQAFPGRFVDGRLVGPVPTVQQLRAYFPGPVERDLTQGREGPPTPIAVAEGWRGQGPMTALLCLAPGSGGYGGVWVEVPPGRDLTYTPFPFPHRFLRELGQTLTVLRLGRGPETPRFRGEWMLLPHVAGAAHLPVEVAAHSVATLQAVGLAEYRGPWIRAVHVGSGRAARHSPVEWNDRLGGPYGSWGMQHGRGYVFTYTGPGYGR